MTEVKPSSYIPNERGLFATRKFKKGDTVATFEKPVLETEVAVEKSGYPVDTGIVIQQGKKEVYVWDAAFKKPKNRAFDTGKTNADKGYHIPDWYRINHMKAPFFNVKPSYNTNPLEVSFVATRVIQPGEEITFQYGETGLGWIETPQKSPASFPTELPAPKRQKQKPRARAASSSPVRERTASPPRSSGASPPRSRSSPPVRAPKRLQAKLKAVGKTQKQIADKFYSAAHNADFQMGLCTSVSCQWR